MANKITTVVEFVTDKATTSVNKFKADIAGADTTMGKFKAGASSALSMVAANAGLAAVVIGGALVTAGVKAVGMFTGMSKAAIDGAAATGLNTEQMSRWIAVADDFEVTAGQLTAGLKQVSKTLDDPKWQRYGIATRDAAGIARDMNDVLLDTFDMLGKITNESDRARIGQQLFGRGFEGISPLIGKTRAEYEKYLGAVEDGQVITAEEAEKAEKTRLALDNLHDSMQELALGAGQTLAPALSTIAGWLSGILEEANSVVDALGKIRIPGVGSGGGGGIPFFPSQGGPSQSEISKWTAEHNRGAKVVETLTADIARFADAERDATAAVNAGSESQKSKALADWGVSRAAAAATAATEAQAEADEKAAEAAQARTDQLGRRLSSLHDYERAQSSVADAEDRLAQVREDQNRLLTEGKVSLGEKLRADVDVTDATHDLANAQEDLNRIVASSIPTDQDKADSLKRVEDAQRGVESATRAQVRAQRDLADSQATLAELRDELNQLQFTQEAPSNLTDEEKKAAKEAADREERRKRLLGQIAQAERKVEDSSLATADAARDLNDATDTLNTAQAANEQLLRVGINVDDQKTAALGRIAEAEAALLAAQQARNELLRDSIPTDQDKAAAARDVRDAELELVGALEGQATAFANQKGVFDGTTASLALQRQELERIIGLQPALAGALSPALGLLTSAAPAVFSQVPVGSREPSLIVNISGIVTDPVAVGRQIVDAQNAYYRSGGYGTINPRLS